MTARRLQGCEVLPPMEEGPEPVRKPSRAREQGLGRFEMLNAFVDATMRHVRGTAMKMWLALFRDTKPDGLARAADTDLARRCGVSTRAIQNARKVLVAAGLIEVLRRGRLNEGPSTYRVRHLLTGSPLPVATGRSVRKLRKSASGIPEVPRRRGDPGGSHADSLPEAKSPKRKSNARGRGK